MSVMATIHDIHNLVPGKLVWQSFALYRLEQAKNVCEWLPSPLYQRYSIIIHIGIYSSEYPPRRINPTSQPTLCNI
jgi:hypothetical protein